MERSSSRMEAGGLALHRRMRTRKLAVVVAVQNVLVTTCLAVTLYLCWDVQSRTPRAEQQGDVHIWLDPVSDLAGTITVKFGKVYSNNMMSLVGAERDQIYVNCTGPYVLYMYLCYKGMGGNGANGTLQLLVAGKPAPVSSFHLQASLEVCRGLYGTAYLMDKERLSLRLNSTEGFKVKNVTLGLSYMLGSRCQLI